MSVDDSLISVASLRDTLGTTDVVLLDVRWQLGGPPGRRRYEAGHLPTARFVDLDRDLSGPPGPGGRHPLPAPDEFEKAMRWVGVRTDSPVVVYDERDATTAARAWWCLRYFGHERVRVLDGGYQAWVAAGCPVTTTEPDVPSGDFVARPGRMRMLDADEAARLARTGVLLDARAEERYRGDVEPVDPVAGHIPGARSAPTAHNVDADGRLCTADQLRARFAALGVDGSGPVGCYCGSGVTAAHEVLALRVAGVPAALYVGSWSNWTADSARPVATG